MYMLSLFWLVIFLFLSFFLFTLVTLYFGIYDELLIIISIFGTSYTDGVVTIVIIAWTLRPDCTFLHPLTTLTFQILPLSSFYLFELSASAFRRSHVIFVRSYVTFPFFVSLYCIT